MGRKVLKEAVIIIVLIVVSYTGYQFVRGMFWGHRRSPQSEAKTHLASIATAEICYFAEMNEWSGSFDQIGWEPEGTPKYTFFLGPKEYLGRPPAELGLKLPVDFKKYGAPMPGHSKDNFTAVAIGNIDGDATLDVWWIDQYKTPHNSQNDVME